MAKRVKAVECYLKLRQHVGSDYLDVHLCRKDGAAHSGQLYSLMSSVAAEELATWAESLGIPVERETSPLTVEGG